MNRYKRGWFGESHRHYLAAKGVKTNKYYADKNRGMITKFTKYVKDELADDAAEEAVDLMHVRNQRQTATVDEFYAKKENIYQEKGYANRREYLLSLADEYGVDADAVISLAELLGPNEDFDGLVTSIQDYQDEYFSKKEKDPDEVSIFRPKKMVGMKSDMRNEEAHSMKREVLDEAKRRAERGELDPSRVEGVLDEVKYELELYQNGGQDYMACKQNVRRKADTYFANNAKTLSPFGWSK